MRGRVTAVLLAFAAAACGETPEAAPGTAAPAADAAAAEAAGPSAADVEYREITGSWNEAVREACGPALEEALGTRDLVAGVLAGVEDPRDRAEAEIEDATHWIDLGNAKLAEIRPALEEGTCDAAVEVALEEAWQFYVKAGTSAVQASQIAGS